MDNKATITLLDPVHCRANKEARQLIKRCLSYKTVKWRKATFGREQKIVKSYAITGRKGTSGLFLTGLLPLVKKHCKKRGIEIKIIREQIGKTKPTNEPKLKGITFREDQSRALQTIKFKERGKIVFPTGAGKTLIALGIMSMFPNCRILFLCHTKDLIEQTKEELKKHKFKKVYILGAGYKADTKTLFKADKAIVLSTIQTFSKLSPKDYGAFFDITIVDEMHHVNSRTSEYGKVMEHNLSPRRYGLTATEPTKRYEQLINEGFFGPVIARLSIQEGIEAGIIARPIINLVPIPYNIRINQQAKNRYKYFYELGIVKNIIRNNAIVKEALKTIENKETTLIIIEREAHGHILQSMLKLNKVRAPFIYGATPKEKRNRTKKRLHEKKVKVVICSKVWKEGINIPSLNHIINACGMKEEKLVMQALGRGMRTDKDTNKTMIKLTDFADPYRYLAEHSILRIHVYIKKGWL